MLSKIQSSHTLSQYLHNDTLIGGKEKSSKSLHGKSLKAHHLDLTPEAERGDVDDIDILIHASGGIEDVEVQPVVVADLRLVVTVGHVGEVGQFLKHIVAHLMKTRNFSFVGKASRIGQVVESKVPNGGHTRIPWVLPPKIVVLGC